jgi:glycosyltransferase involved in cell wall biosynthesis
MAGANPYPVHWLFFADEKRPMSMRMVMGMRLAETDPVVMIETPASVRRTLRVPRFEERVSRIAGTKAGWHYHPLHFPVRISGFSHAVRHLNLLLLQREMSRISPEGQTRIACFDSPSQHHLAGKLGEQQSIYLAIDDRTRTVYGEPIPGELESEKCLLRKVDRAICVSEFLARALKERMAEEHRIPVHVLPNGYDERLFDPGRSWNRPSVLADLPGPIILIAGHLSERIDWDGIITAARIRPEWVWLFVGPADQGLPEKLESLAKSGNRLVWKAPVPMQEMPALIAHCDACAVPYTLNPFTLASSPLKGVEYLAMGAPVLSTRIPALLHYGSAIRWVEQRDGYSYARALDNIKSEQRNPAASKARRMAVSGDSHDVRVRQFRQILVEDVLENKTAVGY